MVYVIKFMIYSVLTVGLIGVTGLFIAWSWSGKKTYLKEWIKTF